jgi:hypothetical protein
LRTYKRENSQTQRSRGNAGKEKNNLDIFLRQK